MPSSLVREWSNVASLHHGGHQYATKTIFAKFVLMFYMVGKILLVSLNHLVAEDDIEKGDSLEVLDVVLDIGGHGSRVRGDGA